MNQVTVIDPFTDFFPGLLRGFTAPELRVNGAAAQAPALKVRIDVTESDRAYVVRADMPGVSKENIDVQIDGAQVSISASVAAQEKVEGERVLRTERFSGSMARTFTLASELDEEGAEAKFENGVLILTLPKKEAAAARRLTIN